MSETQLRPSLKEYLETTEGRTGDAFEGPALAEMAGYTVDDARAEGWQDIFEAGQSTPLQADQEPGPPRTRRRGLVRAFLRGLIYTAPVLAMWSLFPSPLGDSEVRFLALTVVLSWGGSMASNHIVGVWLWGDEAVAWMIALGAATATVLASCTVGLVLVRNGVVSSEVAVIGGIQTLYFFTASPLMLRRRNVGLGLIAVLGAVAGLCAEAANVPPLAGLVDPSRADEFRLLAAACLVAPSLLLARQVLWAVATKDAGRWVAPLPKDTLAFGAYGVMFGCLVLWGPVVSPSSAATVLTLIIVGGIALAEVAVTRVRQRTDAILDERFDPRAFTRRARRAVVTGALIYMVPVGMATAGVAAFLSGWRAPGLEVALAVPAVMGLGAAQVLSLIGMALHGIRQVAVTITACTGALLVLTPHVGDAREQISLYLADVTVLSASLLVVALRLAVHPINHV